MRLSRYFLPVLKENPSEAQIVSHRYMLRAGMIKQQAAGIYSWLPLGFKVLRRIEQIVHEEQVRAGHIPLLMPTLQPADLWRESAATTTTARRCCASPTATSATCSMGPPTRR
jgi:prolyl-tRNA synthetase